MFDTLVQTLQSYFFIGGNPAKLHSTISPKICNIMSVTETSVIIALRLLKDHTPVVLRADNCIQWISHHPADKIYRIGRPEYILSAG